MNNNQTNFSVPESDFGGAAAAFSNAAISIGFVYTTFFLIGSDALMNNETLIDLAIKNPASLVIQDLLKILSAAALVLVIKILYFRLRNDAPKPMSRALISGIFSITCLLINAILSLWLVFSASSGSLEREFIKELNFFIGVLALLVVFTNGLWYLLVNWTALKNKRLPKLLCYLGLFMGFVSLVPFFGIIVLFLSIVWFTWLGMTLLKNNPIKNSEENF